MKIGGLSCAHRVTAVGVSIYSFLRLSVLPFIFYRSATTLDGIGGLTAL